MRSVSWTGISIGAAMAVVAACGGHASPIRTTQGIPAAPAITTGIGASTPVSGALLTPVPGAPMLPGGAATAAAAQAPAIAYPWYVPAQSQTGLTVPGFGQAQAAADNALLSVYLGPQVFNPPATGPSSGPNLPPQPTAVPDTAAQAVVDAIKGQGVSADDIKIDRNGGMATITATVRHLDALDAIAQAAAKAADAHGMSVSTNVTYAVSDCASLEQAALRAAVSDAHARVSILAKALDVTTGSVAGAGYTVYPAFGANACESGGIVPYPVVNSAAGSVAGGQAPEVQLSVSVTVTFSIK